MDRPDSSSNGDDDRQNLIEQKERKQRQLPSPRSTTTFHIYDGDVDHHRDIRRRFATLKLGDLFNKLFLIFFNFIPLVVLILFSPPTSRASSSPTSPSLSPIHSLISSTSPNYKLSSCSSSSSSVSSTSGTKRIPIPL
ncbi:hypothetical protein RchiOBHm_Chr5g0054241 [Rosa chinensis]|uniref:Transmembrane protein n=1 Tax=Rosa chinensis TaxID=74649 RepID=A0A2P6QG37_ROSCH|nr:hypothetical protein RchiOBHm_Chr5g0054241 [Rosa chinensis]